jgi:flagellar hook assembly protein FlgD
LRIFDAAGRLVRTLVDRELSGGRHEARWNACDDRGREVSPGVYFYQLRRGPLSQVRKLVVVR